MSILPLSVCEKQPKQKISQKPNLHIIMLFSLKIRLRQLVETNERTFFHVDSVVHIHQCHELPRPL